MNNSQLVSYFVLKYLLENFGVDLLYVTYARPCCVLRSMGIMSVDDDGAWMWRRRRIDLIKDERTTTTNALVGITMHRGIRCDGQMRRWRSHWFTSSTMANSILLVVGIIQQFLDIQSPSRANIDRRSLAVCSLIACYRPILSFHWCATVSVRVIVRIRL